MNVNQAHSGLQTIKFAFSRTLFGIETTGVPVKYIFVPCFKEFEVPVDTILEQSLNVSLNRVSEFLAKI